MTSCNILFPFGKSKGVLDIFAIKIKMGAANKNRNPVASTGGMCSTATFMANHVVPQVIETETNSAVVIKSDLYLSVVVAIMD